MLKEGSREEKRENREGMERKKEVESM